MRLLLATLMLLLVGCGEYPESSPRIDGQAVEPFGQTFSNSWLGTGRIHSDPIINCVSVKTTIETNSSHPQVIAVKNTEVQCADRVFKLADRVLKIDIEKQATFENDIQVGQAPHYISNGGRWFTFKVDLPEIGRGPFYMALLAFPAGTFTDEPGPTMFFDVALSANGTNRVFSSLLKPEH